MLAQVLDCWALARSRGVLRGSAKAHAAGAGGLRMVCGLPHCTVTQFRGKDKYRGADTHSWHTCRMAIGALVVHAAWMSHEDVTTLTASMDSAALCHAYNHFTFSIRAALMALGYEAPAGKSKPTSCATAITMAQFLDIPGSREV